jgi:hypothetical protein
MTMVDNARVLALAEYMEGTARIAEHERRRNYTIRVKLLREFAAALRAMVDVPAGVSPEQAALDAVYAVYRRQR